MKKYFLIIVLVFLVAGCDIGFDEMNVNPAIATTIEPEYKLTYTQLQTAGDGIPYLFWNLICIQPYMQYMVAYNEGAYYAQNTRPFRMYDEQYPKAVKAIVDLVHQLEGMGEPAKIDLAIAKVQRTLIYSRLTDVYGDVPYSEAGLAVLEGIGLPKFDKQSDIYADMLLTLEEASAVLSAGGTSSFGSNDLFFSGDVAKWNKFSNSLMLRLAMRMIKVDNAGANTWAAKAISGGVMESNDDIAYLKYDIDPDKWDIQGNPLIQSIATRTNTTVRMVSTFVDALKNTDDPRLSVWCSLSDGSTDPANQLGLPPGYAVGDIGSLPNTDVHAYSMPNIAIFGTGDDRSHYNQPLIMQSYAEVEFLVAEAASRWGLAGGNVQAHYEAGVEAAMLQLSIYNDVTPITNAQVDAYLLANPFDGSMELEMIGDQYWIAAFPNAIEGWQNWKRTGFPDLVPVDSPQGTTGGQLPRRLNYTPNSKVYNTTNYETAVDQMGGDIQTTRMWWDAD